MLHGNRSTVRRKPAILSRPLSVMHPVKAPGPRCIHDSAVLLVPRPLKPWWPRCRFYLMALGNEVDLHTPSMESASIDWLERNQNAVMLLPGDTETTDVQLTAPGRWVFQCRVADHISAGEHAQACQAARLIGCVAGRAAAAAAAAVGRPCPSASAVGSAAAAAVPGRSATADDVSRTNWCRHARAVLGAPGKRPRSPVRQRQRRQHAADCSARLHRRQLGSHLLHWQVSKPSSTAGCI
jgi:hypothetical protein